MHNCKYCLWCWDGECHHAHRSARSRFVSIGWSFRRCPFFRFDCRQLPTFWNKFLRGI